MAEIRKRKREIQDIGSDDVNFRTRNCRRKTLPPLPTRNLLQSPVKRSSTPPFLFNKENCSPQLNTGAGKPTLSVKKNKLHRTLSNRISRSLRKSKLKRCQDYSLSVDNYQLLTTLGVSRCRPRYNCSDLNGCLNTENDAKKNGQFEKMNGSSLKESVSGESKEKPKDHDLQQKIDHEIKMREGTAKLLAASKHPNQLLEASKNLLTSNTRIISYMTELQKRKTAEVLGKQESTEGNQLPCKAKLSISDIRIPLMWKDSDHFKNKGDYRRYAVFCLLKLGTEIFDTTMINNVDRSMTDITFEDVILFNDVSHDFECQFEIYCHKLHEDMSMASTPKKIRKKINDLSGSVGRSVGKRLSGLNDADIIGNMVLGPKFEMVAKGTMKLTHVDELVKTLDLEVECSGDGCELPLFGHYCCRLAALPSCLVEPAVTGFLCLQEDNDLSKWKRYWCVLKTLQLACWSAPEDVEVAQPLLTIPVTKFTQISDADPCTCTRSHTFQLRTITKMAIMDNTLAAESKEDLNRWWEGLQQHLLDQALWKQACEEVMFFKEPTQKRTASFVRKKSIYDETELSESEKAIAHEIKFDDQELSKMLTTLMGEAKQIRGETSQTS